MALCDLAPTWQLRPKHSCSPNEETNFGGQLFPMDLHRGGGKVIIINFWKKKNHLGKIKMKKVMGVVALNDHPHCPHYSPLSNPQVQQITSAGSVCTREALTDVARRLCGADVAFVWLSQFRLQPAGSANTLLRNKRVSWESGGGGRVYFLSAPPASPFSSYFSIFSPNNRWKYFILSVWCGLSVFFSCGIVWWMYKAGEVCVWGWGRLHADQRHSPFSAF